MHRVRPREGRRGGARRRGGPSSAARPDVADHRWARPRAVEARARRARSRGDVLRRRDPVAGAGGRPRCRSARAGRARRRGAAQRRRGRRRIAGRAGRARRRDGRCAGRLPRPAVRSTARSTRHGRGPCSAPSCGACVPCSDEPPRRRDEPVPAAARRQPGRLVPVGRRGARAGACGGQADPALGGLQRLPLVPRDGPRVVREHGHGGPDERALRQRQGRPRGAARRRRALHGRHRLDDRAGRLADDGLPHSRGRAVLRRDLLPTRAASRAAVIPAAAARSRRGLADAAERRRRAGPEARRGRRALGSDRAVGRAAHARAARRGGAGESRAPSTV